METSEPSSCYNCGLESSGKYCANCGQRQGVSKITFKSLGSDFFGRIFSLDAKLLRTFIDLSVRPAQASIEYVEGNRVKYMGPIAYFFIALTFEILLASYLGVNIIEMGKPAQEAIAGQDLNDAQVQIQNWFSQKISENLRTFSFLRIPFIAVAAMWFFRKQYNFLEHSVMAFYTHGHLVWISLISIPLYYFTGRAFLGVSFAITFIYFAWTCIDFYSGKSKVRRFLKGLLAQAVGFALFLVVFIVVFVVGLVLYIRFIDPTLFGPVN